MNVLAPFVINIYVCHVKQSSSDVLISIVSCCLLIQKVLCVS